MKRKAIDPSRIGLYLLMVLFAGLFLLPIYVMLSSSLKTFAEVQDLSKMWSSTGKLEFGELSGCMVWDTGKRAARIIE